MTKNISLYQKYTYSKLNYLINWASTTNYFINFNGILFGLKLVSARVYTVTAGEEVRSYRETCPALGQGSSWFSSSVNCRLLFPLLGSVAGLFSWCPWHFVNPPDPVYSWLYLDNRIIPCSGPTHAKPWPGLGSMLGNIWPKTPRPSLVTFGKAQ